MGEASLGEDQSHSGQGKAMGIGGAFNDMGLGPRTNTQVIEKSEMVTGLKAGIWGMIIWGR